MRKQALIGAVAAALLAVEARAQDIPEFNVERHCKSMAAMSGGSNFMLKACYDQEQATYDAAKAEWPTLDGKIKKHCIGMARMGGPPSYFMLHTCIQQEVSAKEAAGGFKLKR